MGTKLGNVDRVGDDRSICGPMRCRIRLRNATCCEDAARGPVHNVVSTNMSMRVRLVNASRHTECLIFFLQVPSCSYRKLEWKQGIFI